MTTFYYIIPTLISMANSAILTKIRRKGNILELGNLSAKDYDHVIEIYLRDIANEIFDKYTSPLARTIEEAGFEFDVTYNPETGDITNCILFRAEFPETFDEKTTPSVTKAIEETLVSYAVYQWMLDNNIDNWQKEELEHTRKKKNLNSVINRRIGFVRKPTTIF